MGYGWGPAGGFNLTSTIQCEGWGGRWDGVVTVLGENMGRCGGGEMGKGGNMG